MFTINPGARVSVFFTNNQYLYIYIKKKIFFGGGGGGVGGGWLE